MHAQSVRLTLRAFEALFASDVVDVCVQVWLTERASVSDVPSMVEEFVDFLVDSPWAFEVDASLGVVLARPTWSLPTAHLPRHVRDAVRDVVSHHVHRAKLFDSVAGTYGEPLRLVNFVHNHLLDDERLRQRVAEALLRALGALPVRPAVQQALRRLLADAAARRAAPRWPSVARWLQSSSVVAPSSTSSSSPTRSATLSSSTS